MPGETVYHMLHICPDQVTPALLALFDPDMPTMPRAFAVLKGHVTGQIITDDPERPTWAAVRSPTFGTLYLGGTFDASLVRQLVGDLRQIGDVIVSRWPGDPLLALLPPQPDYDGWTLYFTNRPRYTGLETYLRQVPPECELRRVDRALFERSLDRDSAVAAFGSVEQVLAKSLGFFLMRGDEILCEAATGPAVLGRIEVGVTTHATHRGRGYATMTCARLIQACEEQGYDTWWDCAKQNVASAALARKLGYRTEREYRVLAWSKRQ
jgi:RimJ/RimL family protein N-acetyltransferase